MGYVKLGFSEFQKDKVQLLRTGFGRITVYISFAHTQKNNMGD